MLKSKKNVFWEALLIAIVIFVFGFLLGIGYESNNLTKVNDFYMSSEISLADELAIIQLMNENEYDCSILKDINIQLANKVYEQSKTLENYESAGIITDSMKLMHKKYDILRTFIWINMLKTDNACKNDYNSIIYLYEYDTEDLVKKAQQNVFSKILEEIKNTHANDIILLPISANQNISSLELITSTLEIETYPAIIINNEHIITELETVSEIEKYLK